ncbi:18466_t:CDS:1, partial [Racocetra persica]
KNVEAFRKKDNEKDKHIKVLENKIIELTKQLEQETSEHTITPEIEEKLKRYEQ